MIAVMGTMNLINVHFWTYLPQMHVSNKNHNHSHLKKATSLFGILNTNFMASCRLLIICLLDVTLLLNSANLL